MFTINIYLRFALIALFIPIAALLNIYLGFWYAFPFYLALPILIAGYIFLGTVQSASNLMQIGDYDGTEKRLNLILKPDWLYTTNRAYFYLLFPLHSPKQTWYFFYFLSWVDCVQVW
jgi:hypothetical protein